MEEFKLTVSATRLAQKFKKHIYTHKNDYEKYIHHQSLETIYYIGK